MTEIKHKPFESYSSLEIGAQLGAYHPLRSIISVCHKQQTEKLEALIAAALVSSISVYEPLCRIETLQDFLYKVERRFLSFEEQHYYFHAVPEQDPYFLFKTLWSIVQGEYSAQATFRIEFPGLFSRDQENDG